MGPLDFISILMPRFKRSIGPMSAEAEREADSDLDLEAREEATEVADRKRKFIDSVDDPDRTPTGDPRGDTDLDQEMTPGPET